MLPNYSIYIVDAVIGIHSTGSIYDKKNLITGIYDYKIDDINKLIDFRLNNSIHLINKPCWYVSACRTYIDIQNPGLTDNYCIHLLINNNMHYKLKDISKELILLDDDGLSFISNCTQIVEL